MTNSFQPITKSDGKHLALWNTQQFLFFRDGVGVVVIEGAHIRAF